MTKKVTNFAASVHARLLAMSQQNSADFHHILQRYVAERFLYRLGLSSYRDRFVLKGAMLFVLWEGVTARPTKDLDLFDVDRLSARFAFEGATLVASISATFSRRGSADLMAWPVALTTGFYADPGRGDQWRRYLSRMKLDAVSADFTTAGARIIAFLESPVQAVSKGEPFALHWPAGGFWR